MSDRDQSPFRAVRLIGRVESVARRLLPASQLRAKVCIRLLDLAWRLECRLARRQAGGQA
jgi:hypothetical protein